LLEVSAKRRDPRLAWAACLGLLLVFGGGLYGAVKPMLRPSPRVVVASGAIAEQRILVEAMTDRLATTGCVSDRRRLSGTIAWLALRNNSADCFISYTGDIWSTLMKRNEPADRQTVMRETTAFLREKYGAVNLGPLGFENAYCLAMHRPRAEALGIRTI